MNRRMRWPMVVLTLLAALSGCGRGTPEAALRAQLQEMQDAAAQGKTGDFMQGVAADFTGNEGMDRAALHNLLRMQTLGKSDIGVTTSPVEIDMQGEHATVRFTAVLTGGNGRFLPDSAQVYAISSGWRIEDGKWRVYYAQWRTDP
ncbi:MAG: nuclear transport factor 2 family protein [Pseudoxanthomonas sp.]